MNNVSVLPTASKSYVTVRKKGRFFCVQLVTPSRHKDLRTVIYSLCEKKYAHDVARHVAADMKRPFKLRGVVQ